MALTVDAPTTEVVFPELAFAVLLPSQFAVPPVPTVTARFPLVEKVFEK
jgi:hypothetical protein